MNTKFRDRKVEITDYEVGKYFDEVCVLEANYVDGEMEDLTEDELEELCYQEQDNLIQEAKEFSADYYSDMEMDG